MRKKKIIVPALLLFLAFQAASCDFLLGKKQDETVQEIFKEGAIDPRLNPSAVGYVPILPIWDFFSNPIDVYVGYDEMIYIIDDNGLNVMDQTGTLQKTIPIPGASDVIQDRRLHTYVIGQVQKEVDGSMRNLSAIYHLVNTATSAPVLFLDTIIHPFADKSRQNTAFRGADDEAVRFTGLATNSANVLYVTRTGPRNDLASISRPDNAVLFFDENGENIGYANGLNPKTSSLKSILDPSGIATFAAPPQRIFGVNESEDFIILQSKDNAVYKALWIRKVEDPAAGIVYLENPALIEQDTSKARRFLYEPNRFKQPADIFIAPDATGYIFIVDTELDSLFQFTQSGYEGVNPPPTGNFTKQILASFGGEGSGPFQFIDPSGVCYFKKTVYVADKGNNRILRFKLSTDIE